MPSRFSLKNCPSLLLNPCPLGPPCSAAHMWPGSANERQAVVIGVRTCTWPQTGQWNSTLGHFWRLSPETAQLRDECLPRRDISGIPWRETAKWWVWHRGKQYQETERKKLKITLSSICTWPCWKPKTLNFLSYMIKWITIFSLKLSEFHIWHLDPWLTKGSMITPNTELGVHSALTTL